MAIFKVRIFFIGAFWLLLATQPRLVQAADAIAPTTVNQGQSTNQVSRPKLTSLITAEPKDFIANIIKGLLSLAGTVTMIMMVYGGLLWMTAAGKEATVGKAKNIILYTSIGLAVIFSSYAILKFVFDNLKT